MGIASFAGQLARDLSWMGAREASERSHAHTKAQLFETSPWHVSLSWQRGSPPPAAGCICRPQQAKLLFWRAIWLYSIYRPAHAAAGRIFEPRFWRIRGTD